jgi:hypothetical protein
MKYTISSISVLVLLFNGCSQIPELSVPEKKSNFIKHKDHNVTAPKPKHTTKKIKHTIPKKPKKKIKLKTVEDQNFSPDYMYPTTSKTTKKIAQIQPIKDTPAQTSAMSKDECISMIGQERFDRYIQLLGSQSSAIKRCQMIKAQG